MASHDRLGRDGESADDPAEHGGSAAPGDPAEHGDPAEPAPPQAAPDAPTAPEHPVPAPGEPAGDMWPGVHAVRAEAGEDEEVTGVEGVALAPPGKPDGEVDTRP